MCKYLKLREGLYGKGICTHPNKVRIYCWNILGCDVIKAGKATKEEIYGSK